MLYSSDVMLEMVSVVLQQFSSTMELGVYKCVHCELWLTSHAIASLYVQ